MSSNLIGSWDFSEISDALFLLSFFLSCLLSCFQCVEKSSRSDCPICYEVRATLLFLDQIFCLGHTTGFKKVIIMASPVFSPSKQKQLFLWAIRDWSKSIGWGGPEQRGGGS